MNRIVATIVTWLCFVTSNVVHADKPLKVFILAGQSNMVGWGDSLKLPDDLRRGNERVLIFEQGNWQTLKPFEKAQKHQAKLGMTEYSFGPEISFAHAIAEAWPDESIGIVKFAVSGTSIMAWKPDWSKEDAVPVGQGGRGAVYQKLIAKVKQARAAREIEFVGFLWLQGALT